MLQTFVNVQRGVCWEISLPTTLCVSCLIKHVGWMFGIVWPPPNFQHVEPSNTQPTCLIVQHLSFGRALSPTITKADITQRIQDRSFTHNTSPRKQ